MPETQPAASTVQGISRVWWGGGTAFVTAGTRVGLSDRKHSLIQVSGVWVKESSLSVCVHQHTGVVSTPDNMVTHQQAFFQETSPHMGKKSWCVESVCIKGCGFKIYFICTIL